MNIVNMYIRRLPHQKDRTTTSETSFVNWLRSMEPFVTTKTRSVKIVVVSGIVNTIAPNNATLPPTSSVVFAEVPDTWQEIAKSTGILMHLHLLQEALR